MNPLDLAIIRGRLQQMTDEMDLVQIKAAFSPVVSEMSDRANAIIDVASGEVVMQGATGLPIFISTMQAAARSCLEMCGTDLRDGDVLVMNDPYLGGTHVQDVKLVRPWFVDGRMAFLLVNTGHMVDMGGASAGGFDPGVVDIYQEGLRIPPTWLVREGVERADVLRLIVDNTRLPGPQEGDFRAQLNALDVGVRRLNALVGEWGADVLREAVVELGDRSEQQMRGYLSTIPDGEYGFRDHVETSQTTDLVIELLLKVTGSEVVIDFTGSSPPHPGPMNLARHTTETAALSAFKHLFPEVPINGGCFRPIRFVFPEDCFLDARLPDAVGGYPEGADRVMEGIFGALSEALPEAVTAASFGTGGVLSISGNDDGGRFFSAMFPSCGGYGAGRGADGLTHGPLPIGLARFPSLEASEHDFPVRWQTMALRADSGGRGRWRGAPGTVFRVQVLTTSTASFLGDRARHRPFGVAGGEPASTLEVLISTADGIIGGEGVSRMRGVPLRAGDWVEFRTPGGGGFGPAAERGDEALESDIADGIVTV